MIPSLSFLKRRILYMMWKQGKIIKAPAQDIIDKPKAGWDVVPNRAFKKVDPVILAQMKPLPQLMRQDYKEYLRNNDIEHDF